MNTGFVIKEKAPDGPGSQKKVIEWIDTGTNSMTDGAIHLWPLLRPVIEQGVKYEFSDDNPNVWTPLKPRYLAWKRKKGFPDTIGIMTGALKQAATTDAIIKENKDYLNWQVSPNVSGYKGKKTGEYAQYFARKRPLFKYTITFLSDQLRKVFKQWVALGWGSGGGTGGGK